MLKKFLTFARNHYHHLLNRIIMKSDPSQCLYCTNNDTLHDLMIEIAPLSVSRAFLFKEQTYRGRCLVAYKDHVNDLNELSDEDRNAFRRRPGSTRDAESVQSRENQLWSIQ